MSVTGRFQAKHSLLNREKAPVPLAKHEKITERVRTLPVVRYELDTASLVAVRGSG